MYLFLYEEFISGDSSQIMIKFMILVNEAYLISTQKKELMLAFFKLVGQIFSTKISLNFVMGPTLILNHPCGHVNERYMLPKK